MFWSYKGNIVIKINHAKHFFLIIVIVVRKTSKAKNTMI